MATSDDRAVAAFEDVLAVERGDIGTGFVRVVTLSDAYQVDVVEKKCTCPDYEYNLENGDQGRCKHITAALDATDAIDAGVHTLVEDLTEREEPAHAEQVDAAVATDGGENMPHDIRLVGEQWEVEVQETRSLGPYENVEPRVSLSGTIPADVGELDADGRQALKARLLAVHKELQDVVERAADNREADQEDWGVRSGGEA